jgi:hypothetical protein
MSREAGEPGGAGNGGRTGEGKGVVEEDMEGGGSMGSRAASDSPQT